MLENCEVPLENCLGAEGIGYKIAIETLNEGRIGIGAQMLGLAQGAFDYAMGYILQRKQFGQPIANFQGMEFQYARAAMDIEAARLLVYNAARLKDAGKPFLKQAAIGLNCTRQRWLSALHHNVSSFLAALAFLVNIQLRNSIETRRLARIYEGTSNMQLATIAKLPERRTQRGWVNQK